MVERALRPVRGGGGGAAFRQSLNASRKESQGAINLDAKSKELIALLQKDGRTSYANLAKEVGLSEAAVRQRVQRLIDQKVMQIVAVTDPLSVGFSRQAMVGIKASGDLREVAEEISRIKEVDYVVVCAGRFDLLAEVVCEDDAHLMEILNDSLRKVTGVAEIEAFLYLRLEKQSYQWGAR